MVQRERNTIRGAKQILTKLRGDETWIPCSLLDSNIDNVIFDTSRVYEEIVRLRPSSTLAKKKHEDRTPLAPQMNHAVKITLDDRALSQGPGDAAGAVTLPREAEENAGTEGVSGPASLPGTINEAEEAPCNTSGTDAGGNVGSTVRRDFEVRCSTTSDMDTSAKAANTTTVPGSVDDGRPDPETMELKGGNTDNGAVNVQQPNAEQPNIDGTLDVRDQGVLVESKEDIVMLGEDKAAVNDDPEPIAHRMTTRAQAQAVSDHATSMRTRSPSAASSSVPSIHPLFLIPDGACPDRDFGLPPEEAEATRRILISYVQKQEEVCRGAEKLYNGLLKVERMKKDVFDSCKAEGHVGEMSDGEDWYDKGKWGLEEDLRKGHDEEEDDAGTQHKKTRGRRA